MFSSIGMRVFIFFLLVLLIVSFMFPYILRLFYPYYHQETIEYHSEQYGVDPLLAAAIIRIESKFDALAESKRGAKGLMQLMPETANWISDQIGVIYEEEKLFEPEYNISLGTWYISSLAKEFDDNIYLVMAAYNAGRGNVNKWIEEGIWKEIVKVELTEEEKELMKSVSVEDREAKKTLIERIKSERELNVDEETTLLAESIYEANKPVLKELTQWRRSQ